MAASQCVASACLTFILVSTWNCAAEDELAVQARLTPCGLVQYNGYPCEISYVTTEDGYVIEIDRVPHGRRDTAAAGQNKAHRYPVLFLPAITSASDIYFLNHPSQSPGFQFADAGFDVWAMNSRESEPYSNHTKLSKDDPKYCFDEIGRYDVAAAVDHVLSATGAPRLTLIALSQGVVITLVFLSTRPEYNQKVELVVGYGPVANVSHMGPPLSVLFPLVPELSVVLYPLTRAGFLYLTRDLSGLLTEVCEVGEACSQALVIAFLSSACQLNKTRVAMYAGHYPIGSTVQNFNHYYQMYKAKGFIMFDYGAVENQKRYKQKKPPAYPLEHITSPVALFSSEGDTLADPRDVADLVARLGKTVILHRVLPQKTFRHLDFAIGYRANYFLHYVAIDLVKKQVEQRP